MINILFLIIFLEGYIVLSSELILIRLLTPFVGNSIEVICIIISAVLVPLSLGYYYGGKYKPVYSKGKKITIRRKLRKNFSTSLIFLALGLTYIFAMIIFDIVFKKSGINSIVLSTSLYTSLFIVYPVYLLGQTIPLITNYLAKKNLSSATGKVLFFSTIGSFIGSSASTLIFMPFLGVNITVIVTLSLLVFCVILISRHKISYNNFVIFTLLSLAFAINSDDTLGKMDIILNDNHGLIKIHELNDGDNSKVISIDHSNSSKYTDNPSKEFPYIKWIHENLIDTLKDREGCPCDILSIGAGGFTLGKYDEINNYTYVDINHSLLEVFEKYLHKKPLEENKKFVNKAARNFVRNIDKKYDLIILDVYSNPRTVPPQLITENFFLTLKDILKDDGIIVFNSIETPDFSNRYGRKIRNSFAKALPNYSRQIIQNFNPWDGKPAMANTLYLYFKKTDKGMHEGIYTDNLNSYYLDR